MDKTKFLDKLEQLLAKNQSLSVRRKGDAISIGSVYVEQIDIWMNFANSKELYIGINEVNWLFMKEDSWDKGMLEYLNLLTSDLIVLQFYRGQLMYKTEYIYIDWSGKEVKSSNINPFNQFWKKSTKTERTFSSLLNSKVLFSLKSEINIKNNSQE